MLLSSSSFANFVSAKIKVTGITCSMCSNSVNKALSSLKFVDKVEVDLEKAIFNVTFKPNENVIVDEIKAKVEGAGFSVGELIADFKFENVSVTNDFHYQFQNNTYHFYVDSLVKLSIEVDEIFYHSNRPGDEINIEYAQYSHEFFGYF